jgi:hypothetical protein
MLRFKRILPAALLFALALGLLWSGLKPVASTQMEQESQVHEQIPKGELTWGIRRLRRTYDKLDIEYSLTSTAPVYWRSLTLSDLLRVDVLFWTESGDKMVIQSAGDIVIDDDFFFRRRKIWFGLYSVPCDFQIRRTTVRVPEKAMLVAIKLACMGLQTKPVPVPPG